VGYTGNITSTSVEDIIAGDKPWQ